MPAPHARPLRFPPRLLVAASAVFLLPPPAAAQEPALLIRPDRVFDGEAVHAGWSVLVRGGVIEAAGPDLAPPASAREVRLEGATLLPGLIEGHSHLLLHPYDETPWTDQVLLESAGERVARGVVHAARTLAAGITTTRDLGSEGAGYGDVGLREAVRKGVVEGPRILAAGPALVATGSYNPKGAPEWALPKGAEEADGPALVRAARDQIGRGVDWVKVYADYRWGPDGTTRPTFTEDELRSVVDAAASAGRPVAAHASTPEGMMRAVRAGVRTIEHGDGGTPEVFAAMREAGVALCPTLAAGDAILRYGGWRPGVDPEPERIRTKKESFRAALRAGVDLCFGGDVGVFPHGDNVRELELMVAYGMSPLAAVRAATSGNARILGLDDRGRIAPGLLADLVAVRGDPTRDISRLRDVVAVFLGGRRVSLPPTP